jgi:hypothetical protein
LADKNASGRLKSASGDTAIALPLLSEGARDESEAQSTSITHYSPYTYL